MFWGALHGLEWNGVVEWMLIEILARDYLGSVIGCC